MIHTLAAWGFYAWAAVSALSILVLACWLVHALYLGLRLLYQIGTHREVRWWR